MKSKKERRYYNPCYCADSLINELRKKHGPVCSNLAWSECISVKLCGIVGLSILLIITGFVWGALLTFQPTASESIMYIALGLTMTIFVLCLILIMIGLNAMKLVSQIKGHGIDIGEKLGEIISLIAPSEYNLNPNGKLYTAPNMIIFVSKDYIEEWLLALIDEYGKYDPKPGTQEESVPKVANLEQTVKTSGLRLRITSAYQIYTTLVEPSFGLRTRMEETFKFV